MTITPSTGTFEEDDVLTCSANGYDPTYSWTGTSGVTGATVSGTGNTYTLPEGPFYVYCTATVSELPAPCSASATVSDSAYGKCQKGQHSVVLFANLALRSICQSTVMMIERWTLLEFMEAWNLSEIIAPYFCTVLIMKTFRTTMICVLTNNTPTGTRVKL